MIRSEASVNLRHLHFVADSCRRFGASGGELCFVAALSRSRTRAHRISAALEEFSVGLCCMAVPFALGLSIPKDRFADERDGYLEIMHRVCCDPLRNLTRQLFPLGEVSGDESSVRANSG